MKHTRCPTVSNYIPTRPALASQTSKTSQVLQSPSELSPTWSWDHPPLLLDRLEANDFQSNAQWETNRRSESVFATPLTGLGIRYAEDAHLLTSNVNGKDLPSNICVSSRSLNTEIYSDVPLSVHSNTIGDVSSKNDTSREALQQDSYAFESKLQTSWSFSSISRGLDDTPDNPIIAMLAMDSDVNPDELTLQYPPVDDLSSWSRSVASGCPANVSVTQVPATTAKLVSNAFTDPALGTQIGSPEIITLTADINMHNTISPSQESSFGIDPATIMGTVTESFDSFCSRTGVIPYSCHSPDISPMCPLTPVTSSGDNEQPFLPIPVDDIIVKQEHDLASSENHLYCYFSEFESNSPAQTSERESTPHLPRNEDNMITRQYESISHLPILPTSPSPSTPHSPHIRETTGKTKKVFGNNFRGKSVSGNNPSMTTEVHHIKLEDNESALTIESPVLDAHHGIELSELKARAAEYRLRNPGVDIDNKWLLSFTGKLSTRGQRLDVYRCYVVGCHQTNKRRDHILIHLGSHLDRRPFKCRHCSSRFLRKNECKRHELGHTGTRPYSCDLCPFDTSTFVRRDLLKRHMQRMHHIDTKKSNKENIEVEDLHPCKRIKIV